MARAFRRPVARATAFAGSKRPADASRPLCRRARSALSDNDGWDRIASDLLTATGKLEDNPAVTWLIEGRYPLGVTDLTDLSSRYFLGIRLNVPSATIIRTSPGLAMHIGGWRPFRQIQTPKRPKAVYQAGVQDDSRLTLASLKDSDAIEGLQFVPPAFLDGRELDADSDLTHRQAAGPVDDIADQSVFRPGRR